jgi:hypothetical protein
MDPLDDLPLHRVVHGRGRGQPTRGRNSMTHSLQAGVWALVVVGVGLAAAPSAAADPGELPPAPPSPDFPAIATAEQNTSAAETACQQFAAGLDLAASNYSDFADVTSGNQWRYDDPEVASANVTGRTALREAAADALHASATPGLQTEIASPMRRWSVRAMKLLFVMGVRGNNDATDEAASELNDDAYKTQTACANAST